ncbi:catalytic [Ascochyta rabiei]|uniref:Catalytic n=1 Tax=Didymella rabiei TaxID=5454 RepID=A0A163KQG4_DIDRA|nr:catalytic [Ascochyta rabiei]
MVQHTRRQTLSVLNKNPTVIEGPTLLHELVPQSSDASAIEFLEHGFKRRKFSYQRLHALSDSLARRLIELTATLENASPIIPVLLPQCPELFILSDVSADLLITNTEYLNQAELLQEVRTICVDHELLSVNESNSTALPHVGNFDLAYVLYTSGSTGLPKAVGVSHRAVTQSLLAHERHIPVFTRFLQFAAPTFDVSIFEIFFPWLRGRTLVGRSRTQMLEDLPATIRTLEADAAELTPTVVGNLLQGRASVPGLRLLLTIGEMLTQHVVTEYGDSATRKGILWAMYGPTEAAIHCTLQAQFCASSSTGNIGYPLDTVSAFLVAPSSGLAATSNITILPWGDEGELVLGGHQIAEGYLNRSELTATSFIDHPEYGRLYRTGDRARFCDDGTIECLGRIIAGQVKLRGQRVELGEVEQTIMKVEGCRMTVASIINDTLVAFCATGSCNVPRPEVLRVCKRWLPSYMIPNDVYMVSNMPQLPSGKIDKRSLESEYLKSLQYHGSTDLQPDDRAALTILRLVRDCLGQELSLESSLAAAGLDSLRAIRIASRLRAEGYDLSAVDVLSFQTLFDLITACKDIPPTEGDLHTPGPLSVRELDFTAPDLVLEESRIDYISPCTPLQEAMLAETLSRPSAYCNWIELEISVTRSYDEISTAISRLAQENDLLRSGFCVSTKGTGSFAQITWKELHETQIERSSCPQKTYEINSTQALLRPFQVKIQDSLNMPRLLIYLHHALYDGWSFDLLLADLDKLLRGLGSTRRPQFRDVSQYYMKRQQTSAAGADKTYWTDLLRDYIPTALANYNGETKRLVGLRSYRGRSSVNFKRLSERAHNLAVNPQVFFQAATGYIMGLYTGSLDVMFGNVTSGRTIPVTDIEEIVDLAVKIADSADDLEFKLTLEFEPCNDWISVRVTYDPSTLPEKQIVHLSRQIDEVVNKFLDDTSCPMSDVGHCFTTSSLSVANPDHRRGHNTIGLAHAVETWAVVSPNKEAVMFGRVLDGTIRVKDTITYSNLNSQANQLACLLGRHGIGQDQLVCIMMEKSLNLYVAILAVLKLGSGYLPLVPDTPLGRVGAILKDAQVAACLSDSSGLQSLQEHFSGTIVDLDSTDLSTFPSNNLHTPYNGSHLAYAVFTSGSTGTPKGVLVTQQNLMSNLEVLSGLYPASTASRMLQSCSQAFDVSVFEIFYTWHMGMSLCTAKKEDLFRDFEASINNLGVTHLSLTPTVAALVDPDNVPNVKFLVTAGEALTEHVRRRWAGRGLYQGYGPSETTNISPFSNTSAFVLDTNSNVILPRGALGELCFGGEQVFRGYLNRPELNTSKLINIAPYGRLYRSGDMGRLLPDDCILSAGRSDDQVKIRGQRVELSEITSLILDEGAVNDCATLLLSNRNDISTLVCYWIPENHLSDHFKVLDTKLPGYMRLLQETFVGLTDTALTNSGASNDEIDGRSKSKEINMSDWELSVADILAHVLQVNLAEIQRTTSFFNLGLDSVSAIRFCNSLRRSGLGDFTVAEVLKNPTVSYLDAIRADGVASSKLHKKPSNKLQNIFTESQKNDILSVYKGLGLLVEKLNPCTPLQEAMLASSASSKATYSNTMVFDVTGDIARLQACWQLAQNRHEILRTSFVSSDHPNYAFAQVVLKDLSIEWVLAKLLACHRPPLHLAIHETGSSTKIIFSCHHALYDGTAIMILLEEIQKAYFGYELSPTTPYDQYLQHLISQDLNEADSFWSSRFADFEPTYFPNLTGKVHKHPGTSKSLRRNLKLPLSVLLHFYKGENDLCFGNVVSGRAFPEDGLDSLVAPCFNTLPVRASFDFSKPNSALIELLHSFNVDSLAHQLTALRRIQSTAQTDGSRLFDTLVILQQPSEPLNDAIWTLELDMGEMDLPIVCEVHQDDHSDVLRLNLHYNTSLLSERDAWIVAEAFDANLVALVQNASAAANESAFEKNASSPRSDTIALDFLHADGRRTTWSYSTLNLIANHIAYELLQRDVGVEDIIPVHVTKSPMFYASILGILKAGAAFAPVHPDLPKARKDMMFRELNAKAILCAEDLPDLAEQTSAAIINIGNLQGECLDTCEAQCIPNLTGSNLAYCLYTSGSTGVPKAVSVEHRSPVQTVASSTPLVPWNPSSRLLQYAAVTFDMCYYDCFLAWTIGFTLCAAEQHVMFDSLPRVINSLDVTLLDLTPSVAASLSRAQVPGVQWLYCIGEEMSSDVAREWSGACVNSYGPTEAAFCTTMFPVSKEVKTSVIGQPYPTTSFAVFSPKGELPLPILSVGELCIGGTQLARGYLGRPELTNERFVKKCGQRFYKSGDMVRMLSDGNFEFVGRADDQVKIRGLRVELGEISHVLQNCDTRIISVATQILRKDATAKQQLVAFLATGSKVGESEQEALQKRAIQAAKDRLPAYMVPQFCIFVDSIPQSMAGKVDKKGLERIFQDVITTNKTPDGISNPHKWSDVELVIRDVLSRLSKVPVDNIHPETSIYQLGLDSISAVQIASVLQKRGLDARHLVSSTSPTESADVLEDCGLDGHCVEAIRPCTPLQQGMVSQFIAKDGTVYFNYLRLRLRSLDVDTARLKDAWAMTMMQHPILRVGFAQIKDGQNTFAMVQFRSDSVNLPWSEGSNCDTELAMKRLRNLQRKALTQLHQPMWDIRLITAENLRLIFDNVLANYKGQPQGESPPLEPVLGQLLYFHMDEHDLAESFWTNLGNKAVASRFPNVSPLRYELRHPIVLTRPSSMSTTEIDYGCRAANITLQAAGIASWSSILSAYTELSNNAAFPCINTVPFPCTHQFTPLSKIQKLMGMSNESLFDSLFAFQKSTEDGQQNDLWTVTEEKATTEYPISIELELKQAVLDFVLPESIDASGSLLNQSLYSITPAKEPTLPSEVRLLHEFVEFTANLHPDRISFEFASSIHDDHLISKTWTYRALVGACFDKCPEASFAMLGILKAGCAFVAIDPSAPIARQAFIVEDSGAQIMLSMSTQSTKFDGTIKVPVIDLDKTATHDFAASKPPLERDIDPQDRSYCLYTSGTTGTPKGCELTHDNAVQAMLAFQRLFAGHWDETSRWLQFASFHFDVSILEQYWSWSVGICVVSAPRDIIFEDIANSIRVLNITHIDLTPSLAQILHPDDVPSLCKGIFITGGESLKQEILDAWGPNAVIYNGYGPTEATIGCTMYPRVPANGKPSNIGPQFDNVGSYVLRPGSDVPVLRGGVGELCVSGRLVGKGYLNRPELTKERFAYLGRFGERVYRTGDLVRILYDGAFDFLGRADDQVKLRGQRLEIGEINSVIKQSSRDFSDVATLVLKHPKQQKDQLVAFVAVGNKPSREPTVLLVEATRLGGAKEACCDKLPPYMVPTHFIPLASMPLNVNNKADGKKLKQIYEALSSSDLQQLSATSNGMEGVWSKQEEKLRHTLAKALDLDENAIEKTSSFYELAGYLQTTAAILMKHPTVAAQQTIAATQHRYRRIVARSLGKDILDIEALAPCTPLQQGMIARYLDSDYGLYFNVFKFELSWDVNTSRLRSSYDAVFQSEQILRTTFVNTSDGYVQAVLQGVPLPWTEHNVEHASVPKYLQKLRRDWLEANQAELIRPFEVHLVGESGTQLLIVHMFHGLYDGNSIELLFEKIWRMYEGAELEVRDVPSFHEALAHGPLRVAEGVREFWERHLTNLTSKSLPSLTEQPTQSTVIVTRDLNSISAYDTIRKSLNVTAQAIAQACWVYTLQQQVHAPITTGMVVSGRSFDLEYADRVIGPMFNTIPYQQRTRGGDTWASIITRAHDFNTEAFPHQHTPLREIMRWCRRSANRPLFETLFVYQVAQTESDWWSNNASWTLLDDDTTADYPLAFEIEQKSDYGFKLTLVTQGHVSSAKTSNELLNRFEEALMSALKDPSTVLEELISTNESNLNGVVDGEPNTNGLNDTTEFEWTENASTIREEIASLTGVETVEVYESMSIFELGLDSIDAIKLSSRLKRRGVNMPVSGIMRGLTIKNMLKNVTSEQIDKPQSETGFASRKKELRRYVDQHSVDSSDINNVLPLTPLQEAMVAEMIASDYTRYYNFDVAELAAGTDIDRLQKAWHTVIESTPILRTTFVEVDDPQIDGSFAQVVVNQRPFELWTERTKLENDRRPNFPVILEDIRRAAVQTKTLDPPVKITLLETPKTSYQILSIAHALYDGWSLVLLHNAVHAAYHGQYTPRPSYEAALADIISGSGSDAAGFWQDYLTGLKPSLFPRRQIDSKEAREVYRMEHASDMGLSHIAYFAKNSKVSLQTLGQTVFALTLASYVGSLDVTFGCILSGRDDDVRSQLLFPTMNTVAIRTVLHGSRLEMLQYVQDNFNNIKQWQHFPLRKAAALADAQGKLFDSLFIYQKTVEEQSSTRDRLYKSVEGQSDTEYPICVEMETVNGNLKWRCAVKEEVMSRDGAQLLLKRLDEVLYSIIEHPNSPSIQSTPQGTSVCGLPIFEEGRTHATDDEHKDENQSLSMEAPLSKTAQRVRQALALVAQMPEENIAQGMSIFHIGLDSISAIKVSSILRKQGITLSVGEMLKAGTIKKIAEVADKHVTSTSDQETEWKSIIRETQGRLDQQRTLIHTVIDATQVDRILPVTPGQIYMLSMWLNTKGENFYPEFVYDLEGPGNFEMLQKSWQDLVTANTILRTQIVSTAHSGLPYVQIILKRADASLTNITGQDKKTAARTITQIAAKQPWVHLFISQTSTGWALKLKIHHALYDGVSLPLLMQQFQDICNGASVSAPDHGLEEYLAVAHASYAISSRKEFWTKYLMGANTQYEGRGESARKSRSELFKPSLLQTSMLESTGRQHGISTQCLFLAAFAKIYAARADTSDDQDVVLGIYLANRSLPIDNLPTAAIPTVNLLPLRIQSPLGTPPLDIAAQIQADIQAISNPANATASLYEISEWTGIKVDTFVNVLSLPEPEDTPTPSEDQVHITQRNEWQESVSRVTELDESNWSAPEEVLNERVNRAYLHAIDVEATIRGGQLDVGIFAPTEMLGLEDAERLVEGVRTELEGLA